MDSETARSDRPALAASLMTAGGAVVVIATFMSWFFLRSGLEEGSIKGADISVGFGVLLIAAIATILGMVHWARAETSSGKVTAILVIVLFAIVGVLSVYAIVAPADALATFAAADVSEQVAVWDTVPEESLRQAILAGDVSVVTEPGLYAIAVGAAVGLFGGIVGLVRARGAHRRVVLASRERPEKQDEAHEHAAAERSA